MKKHKLLIVLSLGVFADCYSMNKELLRMPSHIESIFAQTQCFFDHIKRVEELDGEVKQVKQLLNELQNAHEGLSLLDPETKVFGYKKPDYSKIFISLSTILNNTKRLLRIDETFPDALTRKEYDWNSEKENYRKIQAILDIADNDCGITCHYFGEIQINVAQECCRFYNIIKNQYPNSDRVLVEKIISKLSENYFIGNSQERLTKVVKGLNRLARFQKLLNEYPGIVRATHKAITMGYLSKKCEEYCPKIVGIDEWVQKQSNRLKAVENKFRVQANAAIAEIQQPNVSVAVYPKKMNSNQRRRFKK